MGKNDGNIIGEIKLGSDTEKQNFAQKVNSLTEKKLSKNTNVSNAKIDLVGELTDIWKDKYKQSDLYGHDQYKYFGRYYCGNNVWVGMVDLDWKFGFGGWKFCVAFFEPRLIEHKNVSLALQKKHINYIAVDEQCNDGYWLYVVLPDDAKTVKDEIIKIVEAVTGYDTKKLN